MNFTHVLYHKACPDGFASAYVAWTKLGDNVKYLPVSYNDPPPNIKNGKVLVCDFSFKEKATKKLIKNNEVFFNIDHHITAVDNLNNIDDKYKYFDMNHSGAILTWKYFYPDIEPPIFLNYIEDYDLWKFEFEETKAFNAVTKQIPFSFYKWDKFKDEKYLNKLIKKGKIIIDYQNSIINYQLKHICIRRQNINDNSYKIAYLNTNHLINEIANKAVLDLDCDFCVIYSYDESNNLTRFSLRSCDNKVNVSTIAKLLKGGGHRNASGLSRSGFHNSII
jgi:nanoRNase/pAp phosphatase (c-di-AMP/oligoRNAs hydrolase)